jgi:hypothetical protein
MSNLALARDQHFTWDDYRSWSDEERWELIGGVAHNMTPALSTQVYSLTEQGYRHVKAYSKEGPSGMSGVFSHWFPADRCSTEPVKSIV